MDAGVDVDVHHADIGAERIGHVRRIVIADGFEARLHARGDLVVGGPGDLAHRPERPRIALDAEPVDVPFEIALVHFELVSGNHLRLGFHLARGHRDRGARDGGRARAIGAETVGRCIGVAFLDHDVVGGDADLGRDDLGPGGLVALALALGAHPRDPLAGRMDADLAGIEHRNAENVAILRRARADDLGEERHADPHELTRLAALERVLLGLLLLAQLAIVGGVERLLHGGVIVARNRIPTRAPNGRETVRA